MMIRALVSATVCAGLAAGLVAPAQPLLARAPLCAATPGADNTRRVFCNRELNMENIEAVGFDMDYTLAQYTVAFDMLAFNGAKAKLVAMGYAEAGDFAFDPAQHRRGLVIDKKRGNFLKMDRHKYVSRATHGTRPLGKAARQGAYVGVAGATPTFVGEQYVNVDSFFQLVDASLYAQLVDVLDGGGGAAAGHADKVDYLKAWKDVRHAVDLCHHDGVIKDEVAERPGDFIVRDEAMVPMLDQYRRAGKRVFLLTNSLFDYTNVVMNFLTGKPASSREWLGLFDVVVVGAGKPGFLGDGRRDMLRIDTASDRGTLHNFVGSPVGEIGATPFLGREGRVFQGGDWRTLHAMLDLESGGQILYVGDHMYGDIVRSKRSLGWRTALIVPELETELEDDAAIGDNDALSDLVEAEGECAAAEAAVATAHQDGTLDGELSAAVDAARDALKAAREALHDAYDVNWGPVFRTGNQQSRFAKQVVDYSCIYTSRASNLVNDAPNKAFRPPQDLMPHDLA